MLIMIYMLTFYKLKFCLSLKYTLLVFSKKIFLIKELTNH